MQSILRYKAETLAAKQKQEEDAMTTRHRLEREQLDQRYRDAQKFINIT